MSAIKISKCKQISEENIYIVHYNFSIEHTNLDIAHA